MGSLARRWPAHSLTAVSVIRNTGSIMVPIGTLHSDLIESVRRRGGPSVISSHHNGRWSRYASPVAGPAIREIMGRASHQSS